MIAVLKVPYAFNCHSILLKSGARNIDIWIVVIPRNSIGNIETLQHQIPQRDHSATQSGYSYFPQNSQSQYVAPDPKIQRYFLGLATEECGRSATVTYPPRIASPSAYATRSQTHLAFSSSKRVTLRLSSPKKCVAFRIRLFANKSGPKLLPSSSSRVAGHSTRQVISARSLNRTTRAWAASRRCVSTLYALVISSSSVRFGRTR
jgi:hypothetical protein